MCILAQKENLRQFFDLWVQRWSKVIIHKYFSLLLSFVWNIWVFLIAFICIALLLSVHIWVVKLRKVPQTKKNIFFLHFKGLGENFDLIKQSMEFFCCLLILKFLVEREEGGGAKPCHTVSLVCLCANFLRTCAK